MSGCLTDYLSPVPARDSGIEGAVASSLPEGEGSCQDLDIPFSEMLLADSEAIAMSDERRREFSGAGILSQEGIELPLCGDDSETLDVAQALGDAVITLGSGECAWLREDCALTTIADGVGDSDEAASLAGHGLTRTELNQLVSNISTPDTLSASSQGENAVTRIDVDPAVAEVPGNQDDMNGAGATARGSSTELESMREEQLVPPSHEQAIATDISALSVARGQKAGNGYVHASRELAREPADETAVGAEGGGHADTVGTTSGLDAGLNAGRAGEAYTAPAQVLSSATEAGTEQDANDRAAKNVSVKAEVNARHSQTTATKFDHSDSHNADDRPDERSFRDAESDLSSATTDSMAVTYKGDDLGDSETAELPEFSVDLKAASLSHQTATQSAEPVAERGRLEEVIERFDEYLEKTISQKEKTFTVELTPPHLGKVLLSCREVAGEIRFEIMADSKSVRGVLQGHEDMIRNIVEGNGYKFSGFDVRSGRETAGMDAADDEGRPEAGDWDMNSRGEEQQEQRREIYQRRASQHDHGRMRLDATRFYGRNDGAALCLVA